jgi:hypothetical protein
VNSSRTQNLSDPSHLIQFIRYSQTSSEAFVQERSPDYSIENITMSKSLSIIVNMHSGQKIDVCTRDGAHAFIRNIQEKQLEVTHLTADTRNGAHAFTRKTGQFNFFSSTIGGKPTSQEEYQVQLVEMNLIAYALAEHCDPEIFDKIPESEIECWMDHVMEQITEKTKDDRCAHTGILSDRYHTFFLLKPCVSMFMHSVSTRLAFEKDIFRVLANFIASRKTPSLPCTEIIAGNVVMIMSNVLYTVSSNHELLLTVEEAFKKLESSGMLVQYIRCSTTTQGHVGVLEVHDELIKWPANSDDCIILLVIVLVLAFWCLWKEILPF